MKMMGNCRIPKIIDCPFLLAPSDHSGYTGKSGFWTWWNCKLHKIPIRYITSCELAGDENLMTNTFIEYQYEQGQKEMKENSI